jgi:hypothetical protein
MELLGELHVGFRTHLNAAEEINLYLCWESNPEFVKLSAQKEDRLHIWL